MMNIWAVAALLALSVCEPMMVGLFGGGTMHLAAPDGTHRVLDGMASAPLAARPEMYEGRDPLVHAGRHDAPERVERQRLHRDTGGPRLGDQHAQTLVPRVLHEQLAGAAGADRFGHGIDAVDDHDRVPGLGARGSGRRATLATAITTTRPPSRRRRRRHVRDSRSPARGHRRP